MTQKAGKKGVHGLFAYPPLKKGQKWAFWGGGYARILKVGIRNV